MKTKATPRQSWFKAFEAVAVGDELEGVQLVQNRFDAEEWLW